MAIGPMQKNQRGSWGKKVTHLCPKNKQNSLCGDNLLYEILLFTYLATNVVKVQLVYTGHTVHMPTKRLLKIQTSVVKICSISKSITSTNEQR